MNTYGFILSFILVLCVFSGVGLCDEHAFLVDLKNGNVIKANSCTVDNGKLLLKFPVGQAEIPISQVDSVKDDKGMCLDLLQAQAVLIPGLPEPKCIAGGSKISDVRTLSTVGQPVVSQSAHGGNTTLSKISAVSCIDDEAESKRVSDLMDAYFDATDGKEKEKLDKELERTIDGLFEKTGTINQGGTL